MIIVICKSKDLHHSQYIYNCSIAVSDIIWGSLTSFILIDNSCDFFSKVNDELSIRPKLDLSIIHKTFKNFSIYEYQLNDVHYFSRKPPNISLVTWIIKYIVILLVPITLLVSFVTLVFAAIDRYCALTFPFKYKKTNTI